MREYEIWIEAEHWSPGQWVPRNANSDVVVTFRDGRRWTATFFSYDNIETMRRKTQETGECLAGRYFWASNMVLVHELTRDTVEQVVQDLLSTKAFESVFDGPHAASA